jgi:hypothetical protein
MTFIKIPFSMHESIATRYMNGENPKTLAKEFGVHRATITLIVSKDPRYKPQTGGKSPLKVNENAFSEITPDSAYWIGFLMADGCVSHGSLILMLSGVDDGHVEKLKSFLGSEHKITRSFIGCSKKDCKRDHPTSRLSIMNSKLIEDLAKYGVTERKTFTARARKDLVLNPHYVRGLIEGDGSLRTRQDFKAIHPDVGLTGSEFVCDQFLEFVKHVHPSCMAIKKKVRNIYIVRLFGEPARSVVEAIYKDAPTYLDRKYKIAQEIMALPHSGPIPEKFMARRQKILQQRQPN